MKKLVYVLMVSFLLLITSNEADAASDNLETVSIYLKNKIPSETSLNINVVGSYSNGTYTLEQGANYQIKIDGSKISLYKGSSKLGTSSEFTFQPKAYSENNQIIINDTPYIGTMKFVKESNYVRPINTLSTEDYLKGVVPREMYPYWPIEALKAQAVSARTYINKTYHNGFTDTQSDQVFGGYTWDGYGYETSTKAVEETKDEVLKYNDDYVSTFFSSSNGGKIFSQTNSWGTNPSSTPSYLVFKDDPYDRRSGTANVNWSFTINKTSPDLSIKENLEDYIEKYYETGDIVVTGIPHISFNEVTNSDMTAKGSITIEYNKISSFGLPIPVTKKFENINAYTIRSMIGNTIMKSPYIKEVVNNSGSFVIKGGGFGHNIGMSQWGAYQMASEGKTYNEILQFYYPGTALVGPEAIKSITLTKKTTLYNSVGSGVSGTISPQEVKVYEIDGNWYKINTWLGKKWIKPEGFIDGSIESINEKIILSEKTYLYNSPYSDEKRSESLNPQVITAIGKWNDWYQINTWLGKKWIKPEGALIGDAPPISKEVTIFTKTNLYSLPLDSKKTKNGLNSQTVKVNGEWNGWYRINTWLGNMWIKKEYTTDQPLEKMNTKLELIETAYLYNSPNDSSRTTSKLGAQTVSVTAKLGNWYQIKTWLGDKWVKSSSIADVEEINQSIMIINPAFLHNSPTDSSVRKEKLNPQVVKATGKYSNWYRINTWLGQKWIKADYVMDQSKIEEINSAVTLFESVYLHNYPSEKTVRNERLNPQKVSAVGKYGEWYLIKTWVGDKWIKSPIALEGVVEEVSEQVQLTNVTTMYDAPNELSKSRGKLNPQKVLANAKFGENWYRINTWLGEKWVKVSP